MFFAIFGFIDRRAPFSQFSARVSMIFEKINRGTVITARLRIRLAAIQRGTSLVRIERLSMRDYVWDVKVWDVKVWDVNSF
jgi:hypothetical protein